MPDTSSLNWMDWITLAIVLVSILRGTRYGVLAGLGDLAVLIAAFFGASALYVQGAALLHHGLELLRQHPLLDRLPGLPPPWEALITFVAIWLALYLPTGFVVRWLLGRPEFPASRVLGGLLGGVRGLVLVTVLLVITLAAPFHRVVAADAARSRVAPYLLRANEGVEKFVLPTLPVRVPRIGPGGTLF
jgi:Colicin V production protein